MHGKHITILTRQRALLNQDRAHLLAPRLMLIWATLAPEGGCVWGRWELLSLGALRLLRSSCFALTQPDAYGAGESRGVWEGCWRSKILTSKGMEREE